jgi:hypothetical protein
VESDVLLECVQQSADWPWFRIAWCMGVEDDMDVVGHDDVGDQAYMELILESAETIHGNLLHTVILEEC